MRSNQSIGFGKCWWAHHTAPSILILRNYAESRLDDTGRGQYETLYLVFPQTHNYSTLCEGVVQCKARILFSLFQKP